MHMGTKQIEYRFVRMGITSAAVVTETLNNLCKDGWHVISHANDGRDEYSFVLIREINLTSLAK